MKKRILASIAALAVACLAQVDGVAATPADADYVTASVASTTLDVALTHATRFVAFQMDIVVPAGIATADAAGSLTPDAATLGVFTVAYNNLNRNTADGADTIRVLAYNMQNTPITGSEGTLFTLALNAEPQGDISVTNMIFVTTELLAQTLADVRATKATGLKGDVNRDGSVDAFDVLGIINMMQGKEAYTQHQDDYDRAAADVNGDGDITAHDLIGVCNIYLNK